MLADVIDELKGESVKARIDTEIKLPLSANIPKTYIPEEGRRLQLYRSIFGASDDGALEALSNQTRDQFGALPEHVLLLFAVARLKQKLQAVGVTRFAQGKGQLIEVQFGADKMKSKALDKLLNTIRKNANIYQIAPKNRIFIRFDFPHNQPVERQSEFLAALSQLIDPLVVAIT